MAASQAQSFSQGHELCGEAQSTEGMPIADWHKLALCLVSLLLLETKYEIQQDVTHKTQWLTKRYNVLFDLIFPFFFLIRKTRLTRK